MSLTRVVQVLPCLLIGLLPLIISQEYRTDYEYNDQTKAFYKLHIETARDWNAKSICELEGASLLAPVSHEDVMQVHRMFKQFPDLGEYVRVKDDGLEHESAEEPAIINLEPQKDEYDTSSRCNVITRDGEIETLPCYQSLPFVCKVDARDAPYDRACKVYGRGYEKAPSVPSCYKIPDVPLSWNQAYAECAAEGAHLVVLNSQAEHDYVHQLMQARKRSIVGCKASWFFYAGFRAEPSVDGTPRVFKTIFSAVFLEPMFAECAAEGAHLVVLNSQAEHDYVHQLMQARKRPIVGCKASWFFYAGFRAEPSIDGTPRVFKTIFNETLEQAGYSTWAENEPNNALNNENCGTLFKNDGNLNDVDCTHLYGFICEKEVPSS